MDREELLKLRQQEVYRKYHRKYYNTIVKPKQVQYGSSLLYEKGLLKCQVSEVVPKTKEQMRRAPKKFRKKFHPYNFLARNREYIHFSILQTNEGIATWVADNYGQGLWSFRLWSHCKNMFHCAPKEMIKVRVVEKRDGSKLWNIVNVEEARLGRYWFRPENRNYQPQY